MLAVDPNELQKDVDLLHKIVVELCERLKHETSEKDKYRSLLRELLEAQRNRKSEQLSKEQLTLFETLWKAGHPEEPEPEADAEQDAERAAKEEQKPDEQTKKRSGRQPLARHLVRERVVHDLAESEKHCNGCGKDLHLLGEETSERYEFIPAVMKVIEDVRLKYACDCTVKTADKPAQPIEKSTARASVLAQVIVSKFADHLPLHRQEKIFERHGVEISRKTMGGWMPAVAGLLDPLYHGAKKVLFESKVIGTDDTGVKVLDPKLSFARTGRIWPYVGDAYHPVVVYDYTATRGRDGPAKFLEGYTGYLQADAYSVYDAFFKPVRGLIEVGCWMHARRYVFKALDSDQAHMGPALHLIARLYAVEDRAKGLTGQERLELRQRLSAPVMEKLHQYLPGIREEVLPKSPAARAVRYALNQWEALTRYLEDGDLEIDNGATERANRDIAIGRGNWTFFGSDNGGNTAAVLLSFIAMCKRNAVEPFAWFRDVLTRLATHPIHRIDELLPHNWKTLDHLRTREATQHGGLRAAYAATAFAQHGGNTFTKVRYNGGSVASKVDPKDWDNKLTVSPDMIVLELNLVAPVALFGLFHKTRLHYIGIQYNTSDGKSGGILLQGDKDNYRAMLVALQGVANVPVSVSEKDRDFVPVGVRAAPVRSDDTTSK